MKPSFSNRITGHALAAGLAVLYVWLVSQSAYVTTSLQFIAPLLVIMAVHLAWMALSLGLPSGFSVVVARRSAQTAAVIATAVIFANLIAPMPADASGGEALGMLLGVVFCVVVIALVVGGIAFLLYGVFRGVAALARRGKPEDDGGPKSRLFDFGSLAVVFFALGAASLEGVPQAYRFAPAGQSAASVFIANTPDQVWQVMERTAQPSFRLPEVLQVFPQPVAVLTDEGSAYGARRVVKIAGREGDGILTLQVVERTGTRVVFNVLSDTSPIAGWVGHKRLIYDVRAEGEGTRVTVTLEYERKLAPAFVFGPAIKGAAYLAMDVLARDIKARAEG